MPYHDLYRGAATRALGPQELTQMPLGRFARGEEKFFGVSRIYRLYNIIRDRKTVIIYQRVLWVTLEEGLQK